MARVPDRYRVALDVVDVHRPARLLEVGCGSGALLELMLARGVPHVVGLDRSGAATAAARRRLEAVAAADRWSVVTSALADHVDTRPFDVVLAVRVNLFWTGPATAELARVRALAPGGRLVLVLDAPGGPDRLAQVVARAEESVGSALPAVRTCVVDGIGLVEADVPGSTQPPGAGGDPGTSAV